jgi:hypothetical protein
MSEDEFTKLFTYVTERFDGVERILENKADRTDLDRILIALDEINGLLETDDQERAAMNAQLGRHEGWIDQASAVESMPSYPTS